MKEKKTRKKQRNMILILSAAVLGVFFLLVMPWISRTVYEENFGERYETQDWMAYSVSDFPGLQMEEDAFASRQGQMLRGYHYTKDGQTPKGLVVLSHGLGGGGQNSYMDVADYLTDHGYAVFAYDVTGNDKSEGESIRGIPQGVTDLDYALQHIMKNREAYEGLPLFLFGHSWGAYAAGSLLQKYPEVKGAVLLAGFDSSTAIFAQQGEALIGPAIRVFMPYISLYERLKFGDYAGFSMTKGLSGTQAQALIIYSTDDTVVDPATGSGKLRSRFADEPRFRFIEYTHRGHSGLYYTDAAREYSEQLEKDYRAYVSSQGGQETPAMKADYMKKHLDKEKKYAFDDALMQQILDFFRTAAES